MLLRGYLQHTGRGQQMLIDGRTYHVCIDLINYYNGNILTSHKALEASLNLFHSRICKRCRKMENGIKSLRKHRAAAATFLDDHKVGLTLLVDLANAAKQKAHTGVLQKEKEVREV